MDEAGSGVEKTPQVSNAGNESLQTAGDRLSIGSERQEGSPPTNGNLDRDYAQIAQLLSKVDHQVTCFKTNMEQLVDAVPAQKALSATWESYAVPSTNTSITEESTKQDNGNVNSKKTMGDEEEDPNDSIILL